MNKFSDWSPDGTKIVADQFSSGSNLVIGLADGSNATEVTSSADTDTRPKWSPDGARIAFNRDSGAFYSLYILDAQTYAVQNVCATCVHIQGFAWSPDGKRIAYVHRDFTESTLNIYTFSDSSTTDAGFSCGGASPLVLDWSSDGKELLLFLLDETTNDFALATFNIEEKKLKLITGFLDKDDGSAVFLN